MEKCRGVLICFFAVCLIFTIEFYGLIHNSLPDGGMDKLHNVVVGWWPSNFKHVWAARVGGVFDVVDITKSGLTRFGLGESIAIANESIGAKKLISILNRFSILRSRYFARPGLEQEQRIQRWNYDKIFSGWTHPSHFWLMRKSNSRISVIRGIRQIRFFVLKSWFCSVFHRTFSGIYHSNTKVCFFNSYWTTSNNFEMTSKSLNPRISKVWTIYAFANNPRSLGIHRYVGTFFSSDGLNQSGDGNDKGNQSQNDIYDQSIISVIGGCFLFICGYGLLFLNVCFIQYFETHSGFRVVL